MARPYKWVGGIGYILSFIPYVNIISSIVIAVSWILLGRDTREKIFTATGILMIITFASGIGILISIFMMLPTLISGSMFGEPPHGLFRNLGQLMTLMTMLLILAIIAIVTIILEIVSHFRAGKIFGNTWFKLAGWFRIITIITALISIPLIIIYAAANLAALATTILGPAALTSLLSLLWPIIVIAILGLLSTIFSIVAFFTIPENETSAQAQ
ncbi:MAG: hypothetical protein N3F65_00190 [Nitrososphaeria archaeon]|nr:hypothetical protein [Nitrososphaeria archaeon]MDW8021324.1 hypothetical protein [Nitrososphaerota archaeon]